MFTKRKSIKQIEEGKDLAPKFDKFGLIPVITTDFKNGNVLMHGYMNRQALKKTIETGEMYYWSRSRKIIWHKGKVSGFIQKVKEIRIDDDQDAVWVKVDTKASCHVGYKSCFYRSVPIKKKNKVKMVFKEKRKVFNAKKVYKGLSNPTKI
jgi:phosphoribosyl-AMP cyclohydrolase